MNQQTIERAIQNASKLGEEGMIEQAGNLLESTLADYPDSAELLAHLGFYYFKTERYGRAWELLMRRNHLIKPDEGIALILSQIAESRGELHDAALWLETAGVRGEKLKNLKKQATHQQRINHLKANVMRCGGGFLLKGIKWILAWRTVLLCSLIAACSSTKKAQFSIGKFLRFLVRNDPLFVRNSYALHKLREAEVASLWLPINNPNATILDVGSGENSLPVFWATSGASVICLDGSLYGFPQLQTVASNVQGQLSNALHFVGGDATSLPFQDNTVEGVSALCAIEHIPLDGDRDCMQEIFRILKPGGIAVITIESAAHDREQWMEVAYEIGYQTDENARPHKTTQRKAAWYEVFCRDYSPNTMTERLIQSAPWEEVDQGFYDDTRVPIRRWLDPKHRTLFTSGLRFIQPLLALLFYRKVKNIEGLTPSSIGYLVLKKPKIGS